MKITIAKSPESVKEKISGNGSSENKENIENGHSSDSVDLTKEVKSIFRGCRV